MEKLKIGDFVRHNGDEGVFKILSIADLGDTIFYSDGNRSHREEKLKLWQPKEGEWCWFWNHEDDVPILAKYLRIEECLRTSIITKNIQMFFVVSGRCYGDNAFKYCEPFIGELPSFLKDEK